MVTLIYLSTPTWIKFELGYGCGWTVTKNGSFCVRMIAIVDPLVVCGLIYLLDCIHISLVSALLMMSPTKEIKFFMITCIVINILFRLFLNNKGNNCLVIMLSKSNIYISYNSSENLTFLFQPDERKCLTSFMGLSCPIWDKRSRRGFLSSFRHFFSKRYSFSRTQYCTKSNSVKFPWSK